jgi:23S rRNA pseudouridine1911/1915/1917 synthase
MQVLYEDNHILIVNKEVGEIVQHDTTGDTPLEETLKKYIREKYNKPGEVFLGIVHRIDRPVSGIVVFARTSKALARLNSMMAGREIEKTYWAVVRQLPPLTEGTLEHYIERNTQKNRSYCYPAPRGEARKAVLHYKLIGSSDRYHLLEIKLETGRHHQIRCQLAAIGSPIRGDLKYGYPRSNPGGGISLHAARIRFEHPVSHQMIALFAPPPQDTLWTAFSNVLHNP